jgi:hypothetical protein
MTPASMYRLPSPGLLGRYLRAHGWLSSKLKVPQLELFSREIDEQQIDIVVPRYSKAPDSDERVRLAVEALAAIEDRTPDAVSASVENIGFDLTRERIFDSLFESVRLSVAEKLIAKSRDFISRSAYAEYAAAGAGATDSAQAARQFIDRCRFGHTFKGSFGFTIKTPLDRPPDISLGEGMPFIPRERLIVQRIIRGVALFAKPMSARSIAVLSDPVLGFSAEMLEDFAGILDGSRSHRLEFDFELSPEWIPDEDILPRTTIEVQSSVAEIARDIASDLRKRDEPTESVITGLVTKMATKENPADLENQKGTFEISVGWEWGGRMINVRVPLTPHDYRLAYDAHGLYMQVTVEGKLERAGRNYLLRNARFVRSSPAS